MNYQTSVVVIVLQNGNILLQYNQKWKDYSFVGGKLEENETPLAAAYREIEEELSLEKNVDFILKEWEPSSIELEKVSKRTNQLTHYKFYLFFLVAKQNFLQKLKSEKNIWIPVIEIQKGVSKQNISDLVKDILQKIEITNRDSFLGI